MKIFKKISLLASLILMFAIISCTDNDDKLKDIIPGPPTGTEIRYEINTSADMITAIKYKKADGNLDNGVLLPDLHTAWYFSIVVPFANQPFMAHVDAKFRNTSGSSQNYTLNIVRDGIVVQTVSGIVPTADNNPATDDIVSASADSIISQ